MNDRWEWQQRSEQQQQRMICGEEAKMIQQSAQRTDERVVAPGIREGVTLPHPLQLDLQS